MSGSGFYVSGTDTGVGKTCASAGMLYVARARGLHAAGMKPVASGCAYDGQAWRNEDALLLQSASDPRPDYGDINPYPLPLATAPQLAARAAGVTIELATMLAAHARLATLADVVVVEGVGGWMAPLADGIEQADLVRALEVPVVLVVGLRLGCLSHARLTLRAIEADGCRCVGWIASALDPDFGDVDGYLDLLREALPAPCLGVLPYASHPDPRLMATHLTLPTDIFSL